MINCLKTVYLSQLNYLLFQLKLKLFVNAFCIDYHSSTTLPQPVSEIIICMQNWNQPFCFYIIKYLWHFHYEKKKVCACLAWRKVRKMLKNMWIFIANCLFFNPGRKMATGFTNMTGITSRTSKLINHHGFYVKF